MHAYLKGVRGSSHFASTPAQCLPVCLICLLLAPFELDLVLSVLLRWPRLSTSTWCKKWACFWLRKQRLNLLSSCLRRLATFNARLSVVVPLRVSLRILTCQVVERSFCCCFSAHGTTLGIMASAYVNGLQSQGVSASKL